MDLGTTDFFGGLDGACLLHNRLADLAGSVGEAQCIIDSLVRLFRFGGFSNVKHLAVRAPHRGGHSIVG